MISGAIYCPISGDLSANILNIDNFLLQTIWANDFLISYRQQAKNEISTDISADRPIFKTWHCLSTLSRSAKFNTVPFVLCYSFMELIVQNSLVQVFLLLNWLWIG